MDIPFLESNSGVYAIICLLTGKRYIGSSKRLRVRLLAHRRNLRHGRHDSCHLQNAWNLYGESQFVMKIVEYCEVEQLLDREQHYLDGIRPYDHAIGFNGRNTATNAGHSFTQSEEAKAKVMARLVATRDHRIENAINNYGKPFRLKSPTGEIHEGIGIKAFARKHGLDSSALGAVISGRHQSVKGWTLPETESPSPNVFEDPNGQRHEVSYQDMPSFCAQHGLSPSHMSGVKNGHRPNHRGWHLPGQDDARVTLISPQGQEIETRVAHLGQFAVKHDLHAGNLALLVRRTATQYLGWTVK